MESFEPKPEAIDEHHLTELLNHAQIELMQEYAAENNLDFETGAREWILRYATGFRNICNNKDCFEGIERTHEATMETIKKELYKK
jgi:hypothetical protein